MKINLDLKSKVPIYIQIRDQLRLLIATGELGPDSQMPPVRDLAQELLINPNTVAKAYHELENEGVIRTQRGMGTFVSGRQEPAPQEKTHAHAEQIVRDFVTRMLELGLAPEEIRKMVDDTIGSSK